MTEQRLSYVEPWTAARVAARMRECVVTLKRLPSTTGHRASVTWWPDVLRDEQDHQDQEPPASVRHGAALADQISRMDSTLGWISAFLSEAACTAVGMPPDAGMVVWCRAKGWSWARIGQRRKARWGEHNIRFGKNTVVPGGNARPSLMLIEKRALLHLAALLNRTDVAVDREAKNAQIQADPSPRDVPSYQGVRAIAPARADVTIDTRPVVVPVKLA